MAQRKTVIIGGSDAGISAGLRARELAPDMDVTLILADAYPNFSICGHPFYLSGEVPDWKALAHRTMDEIRQEGIRVVPEQRVSAIHTRERQVIAEDSAGHAQAFQ